MSKTDARVLCHYLRLKGYAAESVYDDATGRWQVVATRLHG
jgi:hypothetical protein